jgi:hypothetical protein
MEGVCATPKKRMKFSEKVWNNKKNHMPYAFGIGHNVYLHASLIDIDFTIVSIDSNLDMAAVLLCVEGMSGDEIVTKYFEGIRGITDEEKRIIEVLKGFGDQLPVIFFHYDQNDLLFIPPQSVTKRSFRQAFLHRFNNQAH